MVLSVGIVDQLETVAAVASWLKVGSWCPCVCASVGDLLSDCELRDNVLGGTLEEDDRDSTVCCWLPSNGVRLTCRYNLIQTGFCDRVAAIGALDGLAGRRSVFAIVR